MFLDTRSNATDWCNYLDLTIVDTVFQCYVFSRFLVCFHGFSLYFHGFSFVFVFLTKIVDDGKLRSCNFFLLNHQDWCFWDRAMFFEVVDHHMQLFAMFAMYRSSLLGTYIHSFFQAVCTTVESIVLGSISFMVYKDEGTYL